MPQGHLIISRNIGESVTIKDQNGNFICEVSIVDLTPFKTKLSFRADTKYIINRNEVWEKMQELKEGAD